MKPEEIKRYSRHGIWSSFHSTYYGYSHKFYDTYLDLLNKIDSHEKKLNRTNSHIEPEVLSTLIHFKSSDLYSEAIKTAISAQLFACMAIEAFINHYGVKRLGERYYKRNIERLGITEKIAVLVLVCQQKILDENCQLIKKTRNLFDARNYLVHPKTREITVERLDEFIWLHPKDLEIKALMDDMETIIDELCAIDKDIHREFEFHKLS